MNNYQEHAATLANALSNTLARQISLQDGALDRVCGVTLNSGISLENALSADECQRIVDAAFNTK